MSYLIPTEEMALAEQYRMRQAAQSAGLARGAVLWNQSQQNLTVRDADYVTDFIPAATSAGLAGWLSMPFAAVGAFYSVFADNVPAAITPTPPTNQLWVFYKVSILTQAAGLPDPVVMLQFRTGAAANLKAQFDCEALYGKQVADGYFSQIVTYENPEVCTVQAEARVILGAGCRVRIGTFIVEPLQNTVI